MGLLDNLNPIGIITSAVSTGLSVYQTIKADKDKKEAKEELENYERQELDNAYKGMSKYPTEAFGMRKDAADVELATMANIASRSGRGLAIAGRAGDTYNRRARELSADQEKYQYERDKLIATGEFEVQRMTEDRENQDIAGYANLYGAADQNKNNALISLGNSLVYGAETFNDGDWNPFSDENRSARQGNRATRQMNRQVNRGIRKNDNQAVKDGTDMWDFPTNNYDLYV